MMWLLFILIALPWYWMIVHYYTIWDDYCALGHINGIKNPTLTYIKSVPGQIQKGWQDYLEYCDQLFPW